MTPPVKTIKAPPFRYDGKKQRGVCYARPPLVMDARQINPMLFCTFKKHHEGGHSWER